MRPKRLHAWGGQLVKLMDFALVGRMKYHEWAQLGLLIRPYPRKTLTVICSENPNKRRLNYQERSLPRQQLLLQIKEGMLLGFY